MKVFIFESTRSVITAEKTVRNAGIECTVIPVPRSVSPLCGMALQINDKDELHVKMIIAESGIKTSIFDRTEVIL